MLTPDQVKFYHKHGYLHIPRVFSRKAITAMREDLNWMIRVWANVGVGWTGPWREQLMDEATAAQSQLIAMHDLHFYAESWMRGVTQTNLAGALSQLLAGPKESEGAPVELHHTTMHVKPCETGHPFPMHQDYAFYPHTDSRFVDVLIHLDDTCHENGEIRFLDGSHKKGPLRHITSFVNDKGEKETCTPHLNQKKYKLADTVAVPAKAGDVVCFNINTIHGSHINTTSDMRRMVRAGYRHPQNKQKSGQSCGRPGLMVKGHRPRRRGQLLFGISGPSDTVISQDVDAFAVKL
ncbi:MAG: phytanoyl-CoA dioxygenase family protein [Opitutaceae bacterium]